MVQNSTAPGRNRGGNAAKWNRLESPPTISASAACGARGPSVENIAQRASPTPGGHRIPGAPGRRYRVGVTQRFSGLFCARNFPKGVPFAANFSHPPGHQKSGVLRSGPGTSARASRREILPETFFWNGERRQFSDRDRRRAASAPGGPSKVYKFLGERPHGVPRADFFRGGELLTIFPFQTRQRCVVQVDRESVQWLAAGVPRHWQHSCIREANIFPARGRHRGASQSSLRSHGRPRGRRTRFFAKFRKLFFANETPEKNAAKFGVGGVGRSDMR